MSVEPQFAARIARAAFNAALRFFQPSPEWIIKLEPRTIEEEETPGQCWTRQDYFLAQIVYDPAQCEDGAEVWRVIGHEVAHLLSSEYIVLEQHLPERYHGLCTHASERLTTRLERLFLRHYPYPGDAKFKKGA